MLFKKELTEYNRYQAFAIHMAISLVIFLILLVCITQYWYPGILFDTGNGWKAIGLIIGIDLILGPLLTLIIFNPKKSSIKFDLAVIALVQSAALIYGSWTIHQTRPIAIAFINTNFITIFATHELSDDIQFLTKQNNSYHLFYSFDDNKPSQGVDIKNFLPYKEYSSQVKAIQSPNRKGDLIKIDPLLTEDRFIQIDENTGLILSFIQK